MAALTALASQIGNPNGRGYLLQRAHEVEHGPFELGPPKLTDDFVARIPLDVLFDVMKSRLDVEEARDIYETVEIRFSDLGRSVFLTIRYGLLEVRWDTPLPGTPDALAVASIDSSSWRQLALKKRSAPAVLASGELLVEGSWIDFGRFMGRFARVAVGHQP